MTLGSVEADLVDLKWEQQIRTQASQVLWVLVDETIKPTNNTHLNKIEQVRKGMWYAAHDITVRLLE